MKTFKLGGIHPDDNKLAAQESIQPMPIPVLAYIPIAQHLGVPAKVLVGKGDSIKTGQLIAASNGFISAHVHSSVTGKVVKVDAQLDANGYKRPMVVIETAPDEWVEGVDVSSTLCKEITLSSQEIIDKIAAMGIVGLGGATFPTQVKLAVPKGKTAEVLIINGVECEPYLTADHRLMIEKAEEILVGISILMKAIQVKKALIGIENNKKEAIAHLTKLSAQYQGIEVHPLRVRYPQGAEKQLIKALTGKEVPSGKLPIEVGCVVNNIGTAYAVYEAVQKNKPLIERVVTVVGKSVKHPMNLLTRIGTPVQELVEKAGGLPSDTKKVISGGPMMGKAIVSLDIPVTKGTSGILIMNEQESERVPQYNCIRCGKCVTVCPMGLSPYLLAAMSENELFEDMEHKSVMDCIECGSCHYVCPSGRYLLDYIRLGKGQVGKMIRNRSVK